MSEVSTAVICKHVLKDFENCTFMSPKWPSFSIRTIICCKKLLNILKGKLSINVIPEKSLFRSNRSKGIKIQTQIIDKWRNEQVISIFCNSSISLLIILLLLLQWFSLSFWLQLEFSMWQALFRYKGMCRFCLEVHINDHCVSYFFHF